MLKNYFKEKKQINFNEFTIIFITIAAFIFLSITKSQTFFDYGNIYSLIYGVSIQFFSIVGLTFLLIMGEIDLSIGSTFGLVGAITGYCILNLGLPVWLGISIAMLAAILIGLINGFFIVKLKVNPIIMTLGMMILLRGVLIAFTTALGGATYTSTFRAIARYKIFNVHITIIIMFLAIIIIQFLLNKHTFFKKLYYVGENLNTSNIYGIKTVWVKIIMYVTCSFTAGIAGILSASRIAITMPDTGEGLEFKMITAAVLGGASIYGGSGSILKSVLGLLFLALVLNGMVMFNINPDWQQTVTGVILVIAITIDTKLNKEN